MPHHDDISVLSSDTLDADLSDSLPSRSPEAESRIEALNTAFQGLLEVNHDTGSIILVGQVQRLLCQFNLTSFYTESEILIEAYLRTYRQITDGKVIENISAWLYKVSLNIIREYNRANRLNKTLVERNSFEHSQTQLTSDIPDFINERSVLLLHHTLLHLPPRDRDLLSLRIGKSLSWREVKEEMSLLHTIPTSEATLRQQGKRVLSRLKRAFLANTKDIEPSTDGGSKL
jgi:RNA polymerase sigma factor (sigma-70 family)